MIRNIWCAGHNYRDHVKEMHSQEPTEPLIFLKAGSCIVASEGSIEVPFFSTHLEYEVELALQFGDSLEVEYISVALDLTARDIHNQCKSKGLPWTLAKSFKGACPLGKSKKIERLDEAEAVSFSLTVNGDVKQKGNSSEMIFPCRELVRFVTKHFPVCPGDLLLTGTPVGVGRVTTGDRLAVFLETRQVGAWTVL